MVVRLQSLARDLILNLVNLDAYYFFKKNAALVVWGLGVGLAPLPGRPGQLGVGRTLPLRLEVGPWRPAGVNPRSRTSWR